MKKIILLLLSSSIGFSIANDFMVIVDSDKTKYNILEWKNEFHYTEWTNVGEAYDCTIDIVYESLSAFRETTCKQNQTRDYNEYLVSSIDPNDKQFIQNISTVTQTIDVPTEREELSFASLSVIGESSVNEGNSGVVSVRLKATLNKSFDEEMTYNYNTQDETTSSVLDSIQGLVQDEFGNYFISVVDNANGGRLIFDGGFPKYYDGKINGATTFLDMPSQFKFLHNIVQWIGETHSSRGKVLFYGDAVSGMGYTVKSTFNESIPQAIQIAGFSTVIKDAHDFGGNRDSNVKATLTLEEMNKYSAIVVMSSGNWESLSEESANNFTTYVNNGGGVYIITDHDWFQQTGNQILTKFGAEFYGTVNRTPTHDAYKMSTTWNNLAGTPYGQGHKLWSGLTATDSIPAGGSEGNVAIVTRMPDIVASSGSLTFNAGETEKTFVVQINGDTIREDDEIFRVMLQPVNDLSHVKTDDVSTKITILNDD